jgi:hypothetical protein
VKPRTADGLQRQSVDPRDAEGEGQGFHGLE